MSNQFLNYLLGGEKMCIRSMLSKKRVKDIILSELENGNFFLEHFEKIIAGGRIESIGRWTGTSDRYKYVPPQNVALYFLGDYPDGAVSYLARFYMFRTRKGREIFVRLSHFNVRRISVSNLPTTIWHEFRKSLDVCPKGIPIFIPFSTELNNDKRFLFQDDSTDGD